MTTHLHLGCGSTYLPGYTNVDSRPGLNVDLVCDFLSLPFPELSVNTIYMCHSLEHIPMHSVLPFLSSCRRILKEAGCLYVSVPDFTVLSSLYLSNRTPLSMIVRAIHGGQEYPGNIHYISFDQAFLTDILLQAGFTAIAPYVPSEFLPAGFEDTSTYEIAGKAISLNLRATF